jgi:Zn-dependent protease with chaperone function
VSTTLHESPDNGAELRSWAAGEREDFFAAIARHRRAAWRVTAVCALGACILALVGAVLLAPLLYCVIGLVLDAINLVVPTPNLLGYAGRVLESITDPKPGVQPSLWALPLAALPGLGVFAVAVYTLRRALRTSPLFDHEAAIGRLPDSTVLAEQRIENTLEEMAVAAGIPAPRVVIIEGGANAAAFGVDDSHATVLVGSALLSSLNREQMQGVAGHLISSIADGDMKIGLRTALTLGLFGLFARLGSGWADREEFAATVRLVRALLTPSSRNIQYILMQLAEPFAKVDEHTSERRPTNEEAHAQALQHLAAIRSAMADSGASAAAAAATAGAHPARSTDKLTWREWALMPLVGPVVLAGFLCGLVSTMMLEPAVAFAWRARKYMADASAVKLTRNPNGLAGALIEIANQGSTRVASWAGHLCVVDPGTRGSAGLFGSWASAIAFPRLDRRHRALQKMGADPVPAERLVATRTMPLLAKLFIGLAMPVVGVLLCVAVVLLVWLSAALSGMFTILPTAILHAILR